VSRKNIEKEKDTRGTGHKCFILLKNNGSFNIFIIYYNVNFNENGKKSGGYYGIEKYNML